MGGYGDGSYGDSPYKDEVQAFDFSGTPLSGTSPLSVVFVPSISSSSSLTPVAYLWDFGDNVTSQAATLTHSYTSPGTYTVSLTIYGNDGSQSIVTKTGYVVVAAPAGTVLVSECLRFAIENTEGEGWSECNGTNFVAPVSGGAYTIQDANDVTRCIIEDADGHIYEQDTFDRVNFLKPSFVDKAAINGSGGTEISGSKKQREETAGSGSENKRILDNRSWIQTRPNDPDYRSISGYTGSGLRSAQAIGMDVYVDGEKLTPVVQTTSIPENGEVTFVSANVEGHRVQYVVNFAASELKITEIKHELLVMDTSGTHDEKTMTEYSYGLAFETNKILHIPRGKNLLRDMVSKLNAIAANPASFVPLTGPDGYTSSAFRLTTDNTFTAITLPNKAESVGGYILSFWCDGMTYPVVKNGGVPVTVNAYGVLVGHGSPWILYYTAIMATISAGIKIGGSALGQQLDLFDLRLYLGGAKTADQMSRYYQDVAYNNGEQYLPSFI